MENCLTVKNVHFCYGIYLALPMYNRLFLANQLSKELFYYDFYESSFGGKE